MATQTIQFRSPPNQTITLRLFVAGSDTQIASAAATEATNRKGTYTAAFTDVPAAEYQYIATIGTSPIIPVASGYVTLTLTTATFQTYDAAKSVNLSEVPGSDPAAVQAACEDALAAYDAATGADLTGLSTFDPDTDSVSLQADQAVNVTKVGGTSVGGPADLKADTVAQLAAAGLVEDVDGKRLTGKALELIKVKTDLISAAGVTIVSPVRQDGTLSDLVVGDAYQQAAGRAIEITVEDVSAGLQSILGSPGATVHLGFLRYGKSRQNPDFRRYEFPGSIVSVAANTVVRFELTTEDTRGIVPSKYDYDIEFRQNANFVTAVSNAKGRPMEWLESATELA